MTTKFLDLNGVQRVVNNTKTLINAKQDALVSGTNIKTINGQSLLGSGNLTISGGGGLYAHCLRFGAPDMDVKIEIITSSATPFTKETLISYLTNNPRFFSGGDFTGDFKPLFIYENYIETADNSERVDTITTFYSDTVVQI